MNRGYCGQFRKWSGRDADHTKTNEVTGIVELGAAAIGRAAEPGVAEPRAAAQQLYTTGSPRQPGAAIGWCAFIRAMPGVKTPLTYIAVHICQPPRI
jgi:hypothetical protein